jgi:hypothetical protein
MFQLPRLYITDSDISNHNVLDVLYDYIKPTNFKVIGRQLLFDFSFFFFFEQGLAPKAPYFIQLTGSTQHGLQHYEIATVGLQYE